MTTERPTKAIEWLIFRNAFATKQALRYAANIHAYIVDLEAERDDWKATAELAMDDDAKSAIIEAQLGQIAALEAERDRLREALQQFHDATSGDSCSPKGGCPTQRVMTDVCEQCGGWGAGFNKCRCSGVIVSRCMRCLTCHLYPTGRFPYILRAIWWRLRHRCNR